MPFWAILKIKLNNWKRPIILYYPYIYFTINIIIGKISRNKSQGRQTNLQHEEDRTRGHALVLKSKCGYNV